MKKSVNALRVLAMDMINKANSGHPGVVLGFAPVAYTLWHDYLKVTPNHPEWFDRDRFVLASGHASSMLYALLHLTGYNISMNDLKQFRQLGSLTPGHPEYGHTPGLDSTSGPLGQGIAMACGMAIAENMLAARYNKDDIKLVDHYTFVECGDGDLQEGVTLEALSLIGHLKLNKLIILFDSNKIQLDGPVSNAGGIMNAKKYFEALGFNYLEVKDPENLSQVKKAIEKAKNSELPTIIECHTTIGYGSPVAGSSKSHGAPLGEEKTEQLKDALNYHAKPFKVSKSVYDDYRTPVALNDALYEEWEAKLAKYSKKYPTEYNEFVKVLNDDYKVSDSLFDGFDYKEEATRKSIGAALPVISQELKNLVCGSADLTASTFVKGIEGDYTSETPLGRNINYGVREHAMGAIANGMTLHRVRSVTGAFFVFSDYMKPAMRMAALMKIPTVFVFTHDSVAVGEDGPTHEPIEQLAGLRAIPNLVVYRPADSKETVQAIKAALASTTGPSVLVLTRQNLKVLETVSEEMFNKGAYSRLVQENAKMTLVASGSEVALTLEAAELLKEKNVYVNVVEMCATELFDKQSKEYKEQLIPSNMPSLFIEMSSNFGLKEYATDSFGIDGFGYSGKANDVIKYLGFTPENIVKKVVSMLK